MSARQAIFQDGVDTGAAMFLRPGQWWFGSELDGVRRLSTLLGSCVAVTVWHPRLRYGGMCHFLLPQRGAHSRQLDGRYGDEAIELLVRATERTGSVQEYEVGMFGGANMFPGDAKVTIDVGAQNAELACRQLRLHGLAARHSDLLGTEHRHLSLDLRSGAISLRAGICAARA